MTANHGLAFTWAFDAFVQILLFMATARAAYRSTGSPFRIRRRFVRGRQLNYPSLWWPIAGRWLLANFFFWLALKIGDVARVSWQHNIFDQGTHIQADWKMVIIRLGPIIFELWLFGRAWRVGLVNDPRRH